ncbi:WD40-repeat-containing domain protein [Ganoderma leucocontextum]|nr:WD40-repeat-containing domain protein [Ganoderma leucocontextum]
MGRADKRARRVCDLTRILCGRQIRRERIRGRDGHRLGRAEQHGAAQGATAGRPRTHGHDLRPRVLARQHLPRVRVVRRGYRHLGGREWARASADQPRARDLLARVHAGREVPHRGWGQRDAQTYEAVRTLNNNTTLDTFIIFSSDGQLMATGGTEGVCYVWETANLLGGEPLSVLDGHRGMVCAAAFSPDNRRIITASDDGSSRIWNAWTGEATVILHEHAGPV